LEGCGKWYRSEGSVGGTIGQRVDSTGLLGLGRAQEEQHHGDDKAQECWYSCVVAGSHHDGRTTGNRSHVEGRAIITIIKHKWDYSYRCRVHTRPDQSLVFFKKLPKREVDLPYIGGGCFGL